MRLTSSLVFLMTACLAQGQSFEGLGDLPGRKLNSGATAVSQDGSVIVGYSNEGGLRAVRWTKETGMTMLANVVSTAFSISPNGRYIGGYRNVSELSWVAFRYQESEGMRSLGHLGGRDPVSGSELITDLGEVFGFSASREPKSFGFRWTQASGMVSLGDLPRATLLRQVFFPQSAVSSGTPDGTRLAGRASGPLNAQAAVYSEATGWIRLGKLPGGRPRSIESTLNDMSDDGRAAVGYSISTNGFQALLWREGVGLQGLGDLAGGDFDSSAEAISPDGSIVVGRGVSSIGNEAFYWDQLQGMRPLATVLKERGVNVPEGWILRMAYDITVWNGKVIIVGWGNNPERGGEAFRAEFSL